MVSHIRKRTQVESVSELGTDEDIWAVKEDVKGDQIKRIKWASQVVYIVKRETQSSGKKF